LTLTACRIRRTPLHRSRSALWRLGGLERHTLALQLVLWMQRHIWYPCKKPAYECLNYYREEEWIKAAMSRDSKPSGHFALVPEC